MLALQELQCMVCEQGTIQATHCEYGHSTTLHCTTPLPGLWRDPTDTQRLASAHMRPPWPQNGLRHSIVTPGA